MDIKKDVYLAIFLSFSIVLSILESFFPIFSSFLPGFKLGFSNIAILLVLYLYTWREALFVSILKVLVTGMLRTGVFTIYFYFSLVGAILSILMMCLFKKSKLSMVGVSIIGSISHSIGQILVAIFFLQTVSVFYYLPYLVLLSMIAGIVVGSISKELFQDLKKDCVFDEYIIK